MFLLLAEFLAATIAALLIRRKSDEKFVTQEDFFLKIPTLSSSQMSTLHMNRYFHWCVVGQDETGAVNSKS
jgi:hypothetical protein